MAERLESSCCLISSIMNQTYAVNLPNNVGEYNNADGLCYHCD